MVPNRPLPKLPPIISAHLFTLNPMAVKRRVKRGNVFQTIDTYTLIPIHWYLYIYKPITDYRATFLQIKLTIKMIKIGNDNHNNDLSNTIYLFILILVSLKYLVIVNTIQRRYYKQKVWHKLDNSLFNKATLEHISRIWRHFWI